MGVESDSFPEADLFTCPFIAQCDLPKYHFICKISGFKTCPEYISRNLILSLSQSLSVVRRVRQIAKLS